MCLLAMCMSSLEKTSIQASYPFLIRLFVFLFSDIELNEPLYILHINCLSVTSFANIFSHSVDQLFISLMVSFDVPKLFSLITFHLFIFTFISFTLGVLSKNIAMIYVKSVCLYSLLGVLWFLFLHLDL